jgi:hypothetical protein
MDGKFVGIPQGQSKHFLTTTRKGGNLTVPAFFFPIKQAPCSDKERVE